MAGSMSTRPKSFQLRGWSQPSRTSHMHTWPTVTSYGAVSMPNKPSMMRSRQCMYLTSVVCRVAS